MPDELTSQSGAHDGVHDGVHELRLSKVMQKILGSRTAPSRARMRNLCMSRFSGRPSAMGNSMPSCVPPY